MHAIYKHHNTYHLFKFHVILEEDININTCENKYSMDASPVDCANINLD